MTRLPAGEDSGLARAFVRRLAAFEEGPLRARAAARLLSAFEPAVAVEVLAALVRASGTADGRLALAAAGQALGVADEADETLVPGSPSPRGAGLGRGLVPYPWLAAVYAAAVERGATEVAGLLVAPPPQRAFEEPRDKADPRLAHLTLGHKKAMARAQRDPDLLARLAAEGDPVVVRELLRNAQLTEPFVVRIASRRPCRPGTLRCIFEARRWRTRTAVALALARNPYAETELALKLLPVLGTAELREISRDGVLHPLLRAVAGRIADERGGGI